MSSLRIPLSIANTAARCGVQRQAILQKRMELTDARKFVQQQIQDLDSEKRWDSTFEYSGYVVHGVSLLCDMILDSARAISKNKVLEELLKITYDKARKQKFEDSRYETEIKKIRLVQDTLKKGLPKDLKVLADILGNTLTNTLGIAGHAEDSKEMKQMHANSKKQLQRALGQVDRALEKLDGQMSESCSAPQNPAVIRLG